MPVTRAVAVVWTLLAVPIASAAGCTGDSSSLHADDCGAWQAGFDNTTGSAWTHCRDKRNDPCGCSFASADGVTCANNRITRLRLRNNNVRGSLPPQWSAMLELEQVVMNNNELAGPLPPQWAALEKLEGQQGTIWAFRCSSTRPFGIIRTILHVGLSRKCFAILNPILNQLY